MSVFKHVKTLTDLATLTGLAAGIGWIAVKVIKESMTSDPSSNLICYVHSRNRCTNRNKTVSLKTEDFIYSICSADSQ